MHAAAELAKDCLGIFRAIGLSHHHAVEANYCVGGDEQFIRRHRTFVGFRLFACYIKGYVFAAQVFGETFVYAEERAHFEGQAEPLQQLFASRRVAGKDYIVVFEIVEHNVVKKVSGNIVIDSVKIKGTMDYGKNLPYQPKAVSSDIQRPCARNTCSTTSRTQPQPPAAWLT